MSQSLASGLAVDASQKFRHFISPFDVPSLNENRGFAICFPQPDGSSAKVYVDVNRLVNESKQWRETFFGHGIDFDLSLVNEFEVPPNTKETCIEFATFIKAITIRHGIEDYYIDVSLKNFETLVKLCDKYAVPLLKERLVKFRNAMRMSANRETRDQIRRCFIAAMKCGFVDLAPNSLMFDVDMGSFVVLSKLCSDYSIPKLKKKLVAYRDKNLPTKTKSDRLMVLDHIVLKLDPDSNIDDISAILVRYPLSEIIDLEDLIGSEAVINVIQDKRSIVKRRIATIAPLVPTGFHDSYCDSAVCYYDFMEEGEFASSKFVDEADFDDDYTRLSLLEILNLIYRIGSDATMEIIRRKYDIVKRKMASVPVPPGFHDSSCSSAIKYYKEMEQGFE